MALSEKQIGYLCFALRPFKSRLPQRYEERVAENGETVQVNCVWLDLEEWLDANLNHEQISPIIGLFKDGQEEEAFDRLVDLGMPVVND